MKNTQIQNWNSRAAFVRWFSILLVSVGIQNLVLMPLQASTTTKELTDAGITSAVRSDLHFDQALGPYSLGVGTSEGLVTLSGSVDNLFVSRRAAKIAESVRGVRGVINQTLVMPESRRDEDIRKDILTAMLSDPATDSYQVVATVKDGVATLTGKVGGWAEAQLAQHIAEAVRGVRDIHNDLLIDYLDKRTDAEIAADVQETLNWDIWVDGCPIRAEVKEGRVTLSGTVDSAIQKFHANVDAWVRGVFAVQDSDLKVDPSALDNMQRKRKSASLSDADIQKAVAASLRKDPRTARYTINAIVENGVVILEGAVGYEKAKTAAWQDARDVVGVLAVDSELTMRPEMNIPGDADAEKALQAALKWDATLTGVKIEAAVVGHVAYLVGSVNYAAQKAEAQDVASRIKGVLIVQNHLTVGSSWPSYVYSDPFSSGIETLKPQPLKSDMQLKRDIERALFWSPFVHRNDIKVTVDNGVATMSGTVGSYLGYNEADRDARKSGAVAVVNRLTIL